MRDSALTLDDFTYGKVNNRRYSSITRMNKYEWIREELIFPTRFCDVRGCDVPAFVREYDDCLCAGHQIQAERIDQRRESRRVQTMRRMAIRTVRDSNPANSSNPA